MICKIQIRFLLFVLITQISLSEMQIWLRKCTNLLFKTQICVLFSVSKHKFVYLQNTNLCIKTQICVIHQNKFVYLKTQILLFLDIICFLWNLCFHICFFRICVLKHKFAFCQNTNYGDENPNIRKNSKIWNHKFVFWQKANLWFFPYICSNSPLWWCICIRIDSLRIRIVLQSVVQCMY